MARALLFFLLLPAAFAQPVLLINNAASVASIEPARIAPRSLVQARLRNDVLTGSPAPPGLDTNQPLTLIIQPQQATEKLPVEILAATWFDVVAVIPAGLPLGPATMTLTYNGGATSSGAVEIVAASFALFTSGFGSGPALAQNLNPGSPLELNALTRPVRPGGYVTLWGTGLGHTTQQDVSILLDGRAVPLQFAGPSPTIDGLDQINIFVPSDAGIADGCYIPVQVDVLGELTDAVSISKAAASGPCVHPLGLSEQQMKRLDEGGSLPIGRIGLYSSIGPLFWILPAPVVNSTLTRFEGASASFLPLNADGIAALSRPVEADTPGCGLNRSLFGVGIIIGSGGVNVGETVNASGPESRSLDLSSAGFGSGYYSSSLDPAPAVNDPADLPAPFFAAGEWEISAAGSPEAEAFRVRVRLPPLVEVTNFHELRTVERSAGITVIWKADGYRASDTMLLQLLGIQRAANEPESTSRALLLDCNVPALAGQVTIEPELLQEFETSTPGLPMLLTLSVNGPLDEESRFTFELTTGEVIPGTVNYGLTESFPIELP